MDAVRTYDKYLSARIRGSTLNTVGHARLYAGGRYSSSLASFSFPKLNCLGSRLRRRRLADCGCPVGDAHSVPEQKCPSKCSVRCKRPVLVVRSRTRVSKDCKQKKAKKTVNCEKCAGRSPPASETSSCSVNATPVERRCSPMDRKESVRRISFQADAPQPKCASDPNISLQLTTLIKTLENQVELELRQKEQLNSINDQLKTLSCTVHNLNEKCKSLDTAGERKGSDSQCCDTQRVQPKISSVCQFCKNRNLPVLSCMHKELFKIIADRCMKDIALTVLLRADNLYHVNVRDLKTGDVLGCLLVDDAGIREANKMGIFQEITTFCVIDTRNTIVQSKDGIFGGIKFEFVRDNRLVGGHTERNTNTAQLDQTINPTEMPMTASYKDKQSQTPPFQEEKSYSAQVKPTSTISTSTTDYCKRSTGSSPKESTSMLRKEPTTLSCKKSITVYKTESKATIKFETASIKQPVVSGALRTSSTSRLSRESSVSSVKESVKAPLKESTESQNFKEHTECPCEEPTKPCGGAYKTQVFCLTELLKAKPSRSETRLELVPEHTLSEAINIAQAMLHIESIDSSMRLSDDMAQYPVRSIQIVGLFESSDEEVICPGSPR
ncbi:hypothetical protein KR222_002774 [Zaprionus bogoriensis]|nr:hypothetical protein KR222_002774 [Zaprionus bogoriensis]